jgi:predicted lipid-binding transport protein (Tim44 family)
MRELSLIVAIVAALAVTIVLAQEELKPAAPAPAAAEPAGAPAARANPFSPLDSGAAPAPGSASLPPLETSPAQAAAVSQTATPATAKLNGILYCESKPLVVINDLIAGVGDEVAGMRVTAIARDKVTLAGPRGVWVMTPLQPEARPAHPHAPGSPAGLPADADSQRPASGAANPAPAVPPAPAETGKPAAEPEAAASAESQAPKEAGGTPVVAAETTDQPIGKENQ